MHRISHTQVQPSPFSWHLPQDLGKALPRVAAVQEQRELQHLSQLNLGGKPALLHLLRPAGRAVGMMCNQLSMWVVGWVTQPALASRKDIHAASQSEDCSCSSREHPVEVEAALADGHASLAARQLAQRAQAVLIAALHKVGKWGGNRGS